MQAVLAPAYGRDYKLAADVEKDWNANKDFVLFGPTGQTYVNKWDSNALLAEGFTSVKIRYNKLERFITVFLERE